MSALRAATARAIDALRHVPPAMKRTVGLNLQTLSPRGPVTFQAPPHPGAGIVVPLPSPASRRLVPSRASERGVLLDSVSFAGCGVLNFYQLGAARALRERLDCHRLRFVGSSAGAGMSVIMVTGQDLVEVAQLAIDLLSTHCKRQRLVTTWHLHAIVKELADALVGEGTARLVSGRIGVSLTAVPFMRNEILTHFASDHDLREALRASCFLPTPWKWAYRYRDGWFVDGGLSDNQPVLTPHALCVSPFWFGQMSHVQPAWGVSAWEACLHVTAARAWTLFDHGYGDCARFLDTRGCSLVKSGSEVLPELALVHVSR